MMAGGDKPNLMARQLISMGESMFGSYIEGSDEEVILKDVRMLEEIMHFVRTGESLPDR